MRLRRESTPGAAPVRSLWRRLTVSLSGTVLAAYLAMLLVLYFLQDALIFPGRSSQGRPEARVRARPGCEFLTLEAPGGERVAALFGPALRPDGSPHPGARGRPTLAYFYGNGQYLGVSGDDLDALRRLGVNVIIPDFLGYGLSGGSASEAGCYAAAAAAYDHLLTRDDVDPGRIVAAGFSLGGAVAIDLAARRPVAGLMVSSTFADLATSAGAHYPFVPAGLLLRHRFSSRAKLASVRCPTLIGHGGLDSVVPIATADILAKAAAGPVTRVLRADMDHHPVWFAGRDEIEAVRRFLNALAP